MNMFQKCKKIINIFVLNAFFLLPWTLYGSEHEEKKEHEPAKDEHGDKEKKPKEEKAKPNRADLQESLTYPKRVRVQEFNFSRFGPNNKVTGILSLYFNIEFHKEEDAAKVSASMPKLRSVLLAKLTEYVSDNNRDIQDKGIKRVIKNEIEKTYGQKNGPKIVREISIFKAFERKL